LAAGFVNIGNNIYCGNVGKYYADKLGEEGFGGFRVAPLTPASLSGKRLDLNPLP